ncbi:thioredoxin domain-containing protein 17 isoform X1 [Octopus bimaculoides]|uniref:Thioredoxin domain-containing protein 17 n=1 Tax=Octopus bimaculoides TaxID=37653 RepID=A0A0L8G501_OCTBM|nr:thioredoxin domain-containing protein 17 isoform X1 [Octopus bimaculoides]|eukprot:XP_014784113.1 PREDICTED: thioredoxin domain-containing protein 17-like [Octopus bimaculoides]
MAQEIHVNGYDEYVATADENKGKTIFALFTGSKDSSGQSWCPDCVRADPVIKRNMKQLPSDAIFIHCNVGDRTFWKDQNNVFRKDSKLRLTAVPTLLKFGHPNQLKEEQCMKDDLIQMLFTEE